MADIEIQKKGPAIWAWIVGLIVLALLVLAVLWATGDDPVTDPVATVVEPAPVTPVPTAAPAEVQQYQTNCAPAQPAEMGVDHQYTSNCIRQLADAIEATVRDPNLAGVDVQPQLQTARQQAQQLDASPEAVADHSRMARDAFESLATAMNRIQAARHPDLQPQVAQLEETARSVDPAVPLLDQRQPVQNFFAQAGDVLDRVATGRTT